MDNVEKEWEKFRDRVMECTNDVCGTRRVGGQRRKRSEWAVKVAKITADWRWGERLWNNFEGNKKMFWKEIKRVRKDEIVKDVNG